MFSIAVVVDTRNHEFLFRSFSKNCVNEEFSLVPLQSIIKRPSDSGMLKRPAILRRIRRWVREQNQFNAVLIFSDYGFGYRSLIHYCKKYKKPVFLYQDGFIIFEPWPNNLPGIVKKTAHTLLKLLGKGHFVSYKSFHTKPDVVFTWGDYFSELFQSVTAARIVTLGSSMHEKKIINAPASRGNRFLYYSTFYREFEKDKQAKEDAVQNLLKIVTGQDLKCDVKLHPLDKNRFVIEDLLDASNKKDSFHFLGNDFLLTQHISNYRFVISEFSTETIFASIFCHNIFFIKCAINKKHFRTIAPFLQNKKIGDEEYYQIDPQKVEQLEDRYFQKFNPDRFERTIQEFY